MTTVRPQGDYRSAVVVGATVVSAGITPRQADGELLCVGNVGAGGVSTEVAAQLAYRAAIRAVEACRQALPAHATLREALTLTVYVRAEPDYTEHTLVADGASRALHAEVGGPHPARAAIGVSSLPGGAPVEVQLSCAWELSELDGAPGSEGR